VSPRFRTSPADIQSSTMVTDPLTSVYQAAGDGQGSEAFQVRGDRRVYPAPLFLQPLGVLCRSTLHCVY
jgi:hypothetical protein